MVCVYLQVGLPAALAGAATLTGPTPQQSRGRWRKAKPAKKKMKSTGQAWHVSDPVLWSDVTSIDYCPLQNRNMKLMPLNSAARQLDVAQQAFSTQSPAYYRLSSFCST